MRTVRTLALVVAALVAIAPPAQADPPPEPSPVTVHPAAEMSIPVFFLTSTDRVQVSLRRFAHSADKACRANTCGHDASHVIYADAPADAWEVESPYDGWAGDGGVVSHDDPRWPTECAACGEPFQTDDEWQINVLRLLAGAPDGLLYTRRDAPAGAMWDMTWLHGMPTYVGPDGVALAVKTPGGDWYVDSEASNCTRPGDLTHKCWVRHGDPRDPQGLKTGQPLHVDKNGDTCAAGAGSIIAGSYPRVPARRASDELLSGGG